MNAKFDRLKDHLLQKGAIAIAHSGGLDSSVMLAFAASVLGPQRCLSVTADTPYMMRGELSDASELCRSLGVRHLVLELPIPDAIRDNPPMRCYLCKRNLFEQVLERVRSEGFEHVADGTNTDDEGDYRPGMKALEELGISSPFREAGMGKSDIRELGRSLGLDTGLVSKPAYACLLTRLEHGTVFSLEDLARIDKAETYLKSMGLASCRVRVHGRLARIETSRDAWPILTSEPQGREISAGLKRMGFDYVTLDLQGYRQGSMNRETP